MASEASINEKTIGNASPSFFSLLFSPGEYFNRMVKKVSVFQCIVAIILATVFDTLSLLVMKTPEISVSIFVLTAGFVVNIATVIMTLFFIAVFVHFTASKHGSDSSSGWKLFSLYLVSCFPFVFTLPVSFLSKSIGNAGWLLYFLTNSILYLWVFILMVTATKEVYKVSVPRALFSVLFPGFFVWAWLMILPWYFLTSLMIIFS